MFLYVPKDLLKDPKNEIIIYDIFEKVKSHDLIFDGAFTIENALDEISALGEIALVEFLTDRSWHNKADNK